MKKVTKKVLLNLVTLLGLAICLTSCQKEEITPTHDALARTQLTSACVDIDIHIYLEGAYDVANARMTTRLNERGLLPGKTPIGLAYNGATPAGQPYNTTPWNYTGKEGDDWTDENYAGTETDWVLVSFRTDITKSSEIARTAALVNADGSITFPAECIIEANDGTTLYVVVEHRGHMGAMSAKSVEIEGGTFTYDFRIENSYDANGTGSGQKEIAPGVWAMYTGDTDQNDFPSYDINGSDKDIWAEQNGRFNVYTTADCNLDGDVTGADKTGWIDNNGRFSVVQR